MRHTFKRSVFQNVCVYDTVVQTLLIGYAKNVTRLAKDVTNGSMYDTNVLLYGVTEASARIRASDTFKGNNYVNIRCVGSDTDLDDLQASLGKNRFNGHVIVCPEVEHARDHVISHLARVIEVVGCDIDYRDGRYDRDFETLIPNESVESDLLWAMFERWKIKTYGSHRNVLVENATPRFLQFHDMAGQEYVHHQKALAREVEPKKRDPNSEEDYDPISLEGPYRLDPVKTYTAYLDKNKTFDTTCTHPVRISQYFRCMPVGHIRQLIDQLSPYGVMCGSENEDCKVRIVCVDDRIVWEMFLNQISTHHIYAPDYSTHGYATAGEGRSIDSLDTVFMTDLLESTDKPAAKECGGAGQE